MTPRRVAALAVVLGVIVGLVVFSLMPKAHHSPVPPAAPAATQPTTAVTVPAPCCQAHSTVPAAPVVVAPSAPSPVVVVREPPVTPGSVPQAPVPTAPSARPSSPTTRPAPPTTACTLGLLGRCVLP